MYIILLQTSSHWHLSNDVIIQVVNLATNAYEVREESRSKMMTLKEKAKKDLTHYTQQIKEYQRRIDHEQRLQDFMKVKEEERTGDFEMLLTQRKEEAELKEKDDILMTYEGAFSRIREITGMHDINEIVKELVVLSICIYLRIYPTETILVWNLHVVSTDLTKFLLNTLFALKNVNE